MNDKRLIIAISVLLTILTIVLLFAINGKRYTYKPSSVTTVGYYDEETVQKIEDIEEGKITGKYESTTFNMTYISLTQEERDNIDRVIDYVCELINDRKIDALYDLIREDYRYAVFRKKEDFEDFINKNYGVETIASTFDYADGILKINFKANDNEKKPIVSVMDFKDGNLENIVLSFNGFVSILDAEFAYIKDKVDIRCDGILNYSSYSTIMMEIENTSNQDKELDFTGTSLIAKKGRNHLYFTVTPETAVVKVPAKKTIRYEMNVGSISRTPDRVQMKVIINGKEYEDSLIVNYLDYSYDD